MIHSLGNDAAPTARPPGERAPIVDLRKVSVHYALGQRFLKRGGKVTIRAVDGIDLSVAEGSTTGLVGDSGSGKSTVARLILGITSPIAGQVVIAGTDIKTMDRAALRRHRRTVQIVFQDPFSSLDPRMKVRSIIAEPIVLSAEKRPGATAIRQRVLELLDVVGLPRGSVDKYPHQFSGGQMQRIAIARALAPNPRLIVLDEPTSALDVSVRAQILNLLTDLQQSLGLSYLFISHDLLTVAHMSPKVAVMYRGRIVETGPTSQIYKSPQHPYTQLLLASIPKPDQTRSVVPLAADFEATAASEVPKGCRFKAGCPLRNELGNPVVCDEIDPQLEEGAPGQLVACHFRGQSPARA